MPDTKTSAPSFEQVHAEHREFKEMNASLRGFLDRPRPPVGESGYHSWAAELTKRLAELHDKLVRHFRHEEEEDFFGTLMRISPGAERQVETLIQEHRDMLTETRDLMAGALRYSEGATPDDPHLRRRLIGLLDKLDSHEIAEIDLMQRLQYRDLGAGD